MTQDSLARTVIPLHLTRPMATALTEHLPSRSVRLPFGVPTECSRWRVVFRNANYRANVLNPGGVTIRTVVVGDAAVDGSGQPNGSFGEGSDAFPDGLQVARYDTLVKDLGETEWATDWFSNRLLPGRNYLLAYGFRTNRQTMHRGIAGGWWTNGNPLNAELRSDPSATHTKRPPLDVRIELAVEGPAATQVVIGDSIAAGSSATLPIWEAPISIAARADPRIAHPVLHTFGGASVPEWIGSWQDASSLKWWDLLRYGPHQQVTIALGSNDIQAGKSLARLTSTCANLLDLVRERISSNIVVCTVTPRAAWAHEAPEKEAVRREFNAWLASCPHGVRTCIDTGAAVSDPLGSPGLEWSDPDGVHFNSRGSARLAEAFLTAGDDPGEGAHDIR